MACLPTSEPAATAARSMSPVESCGMSSVSTILGAWEPLPAPGGPKRIMTVFESEAIMQASSDERPPRATCSQRVDAKALTDSSCRRTSGSFACERTALRGRGPERATKLVAVSVSDTTSDDSIFFESKSGSAFLARTVNEIGISLHSSLLPSLLKKVKASGRGGTRRVDAFVHTLAMKEEAVCRV